MEFIHHFWILFALPWLAIARLVVDICDTQGKQKTDNNEGDEEDVKTIIKIHINIHFDANYVVYFVRYEKISNKRNGQMPFANMLFLMFTINLMKPKNRFFTRTLAIRFFLSILGQITHRRWKRKKKTLLDFLFNTNTTNDTTLWKICSPFPPLRDIICLFIIFNAGHLYLTACLPMYECIICMCVRIWTEKRREE